MDSITIVNDLKTGLSELCEAAHLKEHDILVVGCSTSEIIGKRIGSVGSAEAAKLVFDTLYAFCREHRLYLAVQCCEHLNRALVIEHEAYDYYRLNDRVNAVPQIHAGGSLAVAAYAGFSEPYLVEHIRADAGMDIGDTFIGMHLKEVAVPVRTSVKSIGDAHVTFARTRMRYIGGERAVYDDSLR